MDQLDIDIVLPRRSFELRAALSIGAETVGLIGPSGAGKTSLLRSIAGLERPRAGRVALGSDLWFDAKRRVHLSAERRHTGYLPQDYGLFPHLTVAGNVRFAAKRDRPDLLERVGIEHLALAYPRQRSGGERQRVALARALAREPRVLLLDEPFGALDAIMRHQVRTELDALLGDLQLPTLLVTHSFDDAAFLAQRVGVIDRGRMTQLATAADLMRTPADPMVAALTGANVLEGTAMPNGPGSTIRLTGGGELMSTARTNGVVQVAIYPWELELADPRVSTVTDVVTSVRHERGALVIRLARFTIHADLSTTPRPAISAGQTVGLRAAPQNVRLLAGGPG